MKYSPYTLLAGTLVIALASLPKTQSQGCNFYYENSTIVTSDITQEIRETQAQDDTILRLTTSPGTLICDLNNENSLAKTYLSYSYIDSRLEFRMIKTFGADFDMGLVDFFFTFCTLTCSSEEIVAQTVVFTIVPENTNSPIFDHSSIEFSLDENCPLGLDISDLLTTDEQLLTVSDMDLPYDPQAKITFSVSNPSFKALVPPRVSIYNDTRNKTRISYQPRIAVDQQLNAAEGQIVFDLIATDQGTPPRENRFPITVNIIPHDLRDPEFEYPYYTSVIRNAEDTGILTVQPNAIIRAFDGDQALNAKIVYGIVDSGNLKVELSENSGGVQVILTDPIGSQNEKLEYIVIKASQVDNPSRTRTVVLVVELPTMETTITTSTASTTSPSSPVAPTCEPCSCTTSSSSEMTTGAPSETTPASPSPSMTTTSTTQSCAPCAECTTMPSETACPTLNPETDCPTTGSSTGNSVSPLTTLPDGTATTPNSTMTNPYTMTDLPVVTVTGSCSTMPTITCPDCPIVTCPGCPTCPSSSTSTCPECPLVTCPSTASTLVSCAPCTTETPPTAITCPTITTPSGNPTVQFEKDQYWSEVIENSQVNTALVTLVARSSSSEQPQYGLLENSDSKYFAIDSVSGVVTTIQLLPIGTYNLQAIARIPSGADDQTKVIVTAVRGTSCDGTQFSSPLYTFSSVENEVGVIGRVELRTNEEDYYNGLEISSSDPPSMLDYLSIEDNGTVAVIKSFNRTNSGSRVILTISAVNKMKSLRALLVSTIVNIDVIYVNQGPQFIDSESPLTIGYPKRTYFDSTVPMPVFTPKVFDADTAESDSITFDLSKNPENRFDIDFLTGSLYFKTNSVNKVPDTDQTIQIVTRDQKGLADYLDLTVRALDDDFILMMMASSDSNVLTAETISSDLSRILSYQVTVLRMEKTLKSRATGFDYSIVVYAVKSTDFVSRNAFIEDIAAALNLSSLSWHLKTDEFSPPNEYEAEKIINDTSKDLQSYTVATAVLASLLGLSLILVVAYIIYLKKWKIDKTWNNAFRAASLDVDKKQWDKRSFFESENTDHEAHHQVDSFNRELVSDKTEEIPKAAVRYTLENIRTDDQKPVPGAILSEEPYCPPSPAPKKSILKDSNGTDTKTIQKTERDKRIEDSGVSFNPTPEVIEVPVIFPEPLDPNILLEEL